ncbi:hypothetical protein GN244_ATG02209 [Phytophthora infestans]|uniref:Uncharacterized protein n=1 Tax=Phytophthora infestans TaxID=4787 RepID=A0A833TKI7_PHYIN|nr:hypothetical protein GN244_ATG02209 [Phytophthora infestans]KAF4130994.1 hypothetical protein GN958_ATG19813 [Phytophthora infestans]KAF4142080.1 hypothetical protein GN958_ATG08714 [Phytophthora infestans]
MVNRSRGEFLRKYLLRGERPSSATKGEGYSHILHLGTHAGYEACVDANVGFFEFANGALHTGAVVTIGVIKAGSKMNVNDGRDLWFVCRYEKCILAYLQTKEDRHV